ncbi:phosphoribosyl 1,2-cyclic phosphate phosphodiesterase [Paramixta manurensis]|uniref:Phosphoribosyl 1,2-cyclic phosphate phosphodiesterase n=1 Tax=Paramixta manurensis TaxID=2740817 RepID=A0A6M8URC1_9GAMM|nr:phosphoribosyl 1,2-cyclic phosphate phosphodiesterase [Erwiniaceae bacterium PD-1]
MKLTFLGTGGAQQVPVFGCDCFACQRARQQPARRRGPCSALIVCEGETTLLDAGQPLLEQRFAPGALTRILLTHYHMDHVQGLFPLRWGVGVPIPVYGPPDPEGCDDLFKHPGLLRFQPPLAAFQTAEYGALRITPLPLIHSKLTWGYLIAYRQHRLAWLCDTVGLPPETLSFLRAQSLDHLVLDCSHAPREKPPRNHNDVTMALALHHDLAPRQSWLTHLSHEVDNWLAENRLPVAVAAAYDGLTLTFEHDAGAVTV